MENYPKDNEIKQSDVPSYEKYKLGSIVGNLNSPNISQMSPTKKAEFLLLLEKFIKNMISQIDPKNDDLVKPIPDFKINKKRIFMDWHNVCSTNSLEYLYKMLLLINKLNQKGISTTILSYVGFGSEHHAKVLAWCSLPCLQLIVKSLVLVFDKKEILKGKGIIIKKWLDKHPSATTIFIDDGLENLENVKETLCGDRNKCKLIHYVAISDSPTPDYAIRIQSKEELEKILLK